mgnify:CR=1 FL=1
MVFLSDWPFGEMRRGVLWKDAVPVVVVAAVDCEGMVGCLALVRGVDAMDLVDVMARDLARDLATRPEDCLARLRESIMGQLEKTSENSTSFSIVMSKKLFVVFIQIFFSSVTYFCKSALLIGWRIKV